MYTPLPPGARGPGLLLSVCDSPDGAAGHSCGEPDLQRRLGGGEAPPARRHAEHQAVAGGSDGQLQGESSVLLTLNGMTGRNGAVFNVVPHPSRC